jgi:polyisoprenoid-binding protein YceI
MPPRRAWPRTAHPAPSGAFNRGFQVKSLRRLLCGALCLLPLLAQAQDWRVQPGSRPGFVTTWDKTPLPGQFRRFEAEVRFDPAQPAQARFDVRVDIASVTVGVREADEGMADRDWFDTKAQPVARFTSRAVKALGGNRYAVEGDLLLKGIRRPVVMPITWQAMPDGGARLSGETRLQRTDWRIGDGDWLRDPSIAFEVIVQADWQLR